MYLSPSRSESRPEKLRQMVEQLSHDETNSGRITSTTYDTEQAKSTLMNEKVDEIPQPRPPGIPPPLRMLQSFDSVLQQESMLAKAEAFPDIDRDVAKTLGLALHEKEVLRRAEEVLLKSKAAAKKRGLQSNQGGLQDCEILEGTIPGRDTDRPSYRGLEVPRKTVPLGALSYSSGRGTETREETTFGAGISSRAASTGESTSLGADIFPVVRRVPTLSNWVHCVDGSIRGQIYNSDMFPNGTEISTSVVPNGVSRGTAIETSSGSLYFLDAPKEDVSLLKTSPVAPFGVPTILAWKVLDTGGIAGLLYECAGASDGDYVETSPIASGVAQSGQVVVTASGSQYFLSPVVDDRTSNIVAAFQDMSQANYGSTITLTKELDRTNHSDIAGTADGDHSTRLARRRSTFSLFGLLGKRRQHRTGGARAATPDGLPMLTQWTVNADTTITGIVSGSPNLRDGDVVTTSEIVAGVPKRFGRVRTSSGSTYFLA